MKTTLNYLINFGGVRLTEGYFDSGTKIRHAKCTTHNLINRLGKSE